MSRLSTSSSAAALILSGASVAATLSSPALAQSTAAADDSVLAEIVVSARRREESLDRVPVSAAVMTADTMQQRGVRDASDLGRFVPNLTFDQGTGNTGGTANAQIFIRGVGQQDFLFMTDPGVGIYVDGVYFPRALGAILDLVDIERVEVLRGPQGTLFGKNTIGGAINIVSRAPQDEFSAEIQGTLGNLNRRDVRAIADLPLIEDKLAAKVAVLSRSRDGLTERPHGDALGDINRDAAQVMLRWNVTDDVTANFSADYTRIREQATNLHMVAANSAAAVPTLWNMLVGLPQYGQAWGNQFITSDPFRTNATGPSASDLDAKGISGTIDWDAGAVAVKFITAWRSQDAFFEADVDHSPLPYLQQSVDDTYEMNSQELQLSGNAFDDKLGWLFGVFRLGETGHDVFEFPFARGLFDALSALPAPIIPLAPYPTDGNGVPLFQCPTAPAGFPCAGGAGNPYNVALDVDQMRDNRIDFDSYAAYFHGSYQLTDKLSISGGGRYSKDEKELFAFGLRRGSNTVSIQPMTVSRSWTAFTPKGSVEYQWNDSVMTYASVSKGFKSGGFNGRALTPAEVESSFDPEKTLAYEVGMKGLLFDRRLRMNLAAFFTDYTDIQLTTVGASPEGAVIAVVDNAGKAQIKGLELELLGKPASGVELNLGVGYTDAEYTHLNAGVTSVTLNSRFVKTPKWSADAGAQYRVQMNSTLDLLLRGDYSYRSKVYHQPSNIELLSTDATGLLSARIGLEAVEGKWRVSLFGSNLTDERYIVSGIEALDSLGSADVTYGQPREYGVEAAWRF
jgi:iron complex outermembrane receptor protein